MAITTAERTQIIELTVLMFNAAPGANYLAQIVALYEANPGTTDQKLAALANQLSQTSVYNSLHPNFETAEEFAADFLTPLGLQSDALALDFIIAKYNAGVSKGQIVYEAYAALNTVPDTANNQYSTANAILNNKTTVAEYYSITKDGAATDLLTLQSVVGGVTEDAATVTEAQARVDNQVISGQTFNLATGAEQKTGTAGNDTFNGSDTTLQLDVLDGAGGTDTLNYSDAAGNKNINGLGLSLNSVEVINVRSVGAAAATTTSFAGVESVNVLLGTTATVTAGTSTNVSVSGATGAITIDGGKDITVSDAAAANDIIVGATTGGTGNISVTDTNVGAADVKVDGGANVALALTGSAGGGKVITVGNGGAAADLPTGAVTIVSANKAVAGADESLSAITVKGGSTVAVSQSATSSIAATDTAGATVTQGDVTITGSTATTGVNVTQTKSTTEVVAVNAVAGVTETASVKFSALTAGQTLVFGGLTFTASAAMTAAEAAAAFANLVKNDSQGSAAASKGAYTGTLSGWTSGAASGDTVVFTSTTANTDVGNLTNGGTGTVVVTTTAGSGATAAKAGVLGVATGKVVIDDNATSASITDVVVNGYGGASTIGATNTLSKLANLTLANSGSTGTAGETDASMTVDAAAVATLNLTINAIKGDVSLDGAADSALKTLNLNVTGADSNFALTAAAVQTLAISGDKAANLSTGTFTALKTVTVSGSAGATFDADEADTLTSVNTSGTSGKVTATIDGTKATYTGGAGVDVVTLASGTALTKAINLGAGDDSLSFAALNVTGSTAAVNGGDGIDTLSMSTATAAALDAAPVTFYTGFERLTLNDAGATSTIDLANLGFTNYVTTSGSGGTLTLDKLASNGTVVLTAAPTTGVTVNVADAATGTADVLNVVLSSSGDLAAGLLTAANVETVNVSTVDTETGANPTKNVDSLTLTADKATAVNLTGGADLTVTLTGSTKITSIDGSAMTGGLTVTSLNTTSATTIKGGSGADVLTAATGTTADVLIGGAGNDTLTGNAGLSTLTGGEGNDLFVIGTASQNVNSYVTITDFAAGDLIQFTGADSFKAAKVALGETAVFQDYANAAVNAVGANDVAWFQFGGNTYIVMDEATTDSATFINNEDFIVKLTGLVDVSAASFNDTNDTIAL